MKYSIKQAGMDFTISETTSNMKGSRVKKIVVDNDGNEAFFKYEGNGYLVSEACSEKMSYEIAKVLGYECAKIELAKDYSGVLGVLNYLFIDTRNSEHIDAVSFLNIHDDERYKSMEGVYKEYIPHTECLKDTIERVIPYWESDIEPSIKEGKNVIIVAHGNSLRGLIKYLDNISDEDIVGLEIPTGNPLVYELDDNLKPITHYYLKEKEA